MSVLDEVEPVFIIHVVGQDVVAAFIRERP